MHRDGRWETLRLSADVLIVLLAGLSVRKALVPGLLR